MYTTIYLICKKKFGIPFSDFRYKDIKYNRGKMVQEECQIITGLNPDMINFIDKILRSKSV